MYIYHSEWCEVGLCPGTKLSDPPRAPHPTRTKRVGQTTGYVAAILHRHPCTTANKPDALHPLSCSAVQLPDAPASGSVQLTREATRASLVSPTADASATLYLDPPSFQQVKAAVTQVGWHGHTASRPASISGVGVQMQFQRQPQLIAWHALSLFRMKAKLVLRK